VNFLCDRPERNAGHGPLEDGIIFNSKNDALDPSDQKAWFLRAIQDIFLS
jgi:hypothetical protein